MTYMLRVGLMMMALASLTLGTETAHADKCVSAKLKTIGRKENGLLSCDAKVVQRGDPSLLADCVQKVEAKYARAFAKAGTCSGDQATCECIAEHCATFVGLALPDAGPDDCESARLRAAAKKASDELNCSAKAAMRSVPVDSACIQKAEARYQKAFARTTGCSGNQATVEATVDQRCVTAVGADPTGGATIGTICGSCPPVTTTSSTITSSTITSSTTTSSTSTPSTSTTSTTVCSTLGGPCGSSGTGICTTRCDGVHPCEKVCISTCVFAPATAFCDTQADCDGLPFQGTVCVAGSPTQGTCPTNCGGNLSLCCFAE
jgi:hypothetical protein